MRKHETAVCGTARTVVWEVGKCENRRQIPFMISIYLLPDYDFLLNVEIDFLEPGTGVEAGTFLVDARQVAMT